MTINHETEAPWESKKRHKLHLTIGRAMVLANLYYATERPPKRTKSGKERLCWLCCGTPPNATFRKKAHMVAQGLGNRAWTTDDECDNCNQFVGGLESDLIASLAEYRLLSPYRGKGSLSFAAPSEGTSIRAIDDKRNVLIHRVHDDLPRLIEHSATELQLNLPVPGYRPISICKVLARWALLLQPDLRTTYVHLRQWVAGTTSLGDQFLFSAKAPPGPRMVPQVAVLQYVGSQSLDTDIAVTLLYEGACYWFCLPKSGSASPRQFLERGLYRQWDESSWTVSLLSDNCRIDAHDIAIPGEHTGRITVD